MGKASAPTPPSPTATAGAQTASNVSTAIANAFLNNTNQVTPLGSLSYDQSNTYTFTDPTTGAQYSIPRFTATQSLTPQEQSIQDQSQGAKFNLANLSNVQSGRIGSLLSSPIDLSGAPPAGTFSFSGQPLNEFESMFGQVGRPEFGFAPSGDPTYGWGGAGDITRTYGPADDFSSDRSRVEQSLYGRLNPQLSLEQQHIEQQLADQGIRYGSAAYTNAMDSYNRQANDARLAVTQTAGQEQQRLMDMAAKRAGFQNAAQLQDYQEQQGRAQFFNTAQQQRYEQDLGRESFYNQAQQQNFIQRAAQGAFYNQGIAAQLAAAQASLSASNQARQQYLNEQYALRNQPINEISALLSGSQIQQPTFGATPQTQIPTTDIAGLINQNFNQQFGNYQQANQNFQTLAGGVLGAVGQAAKGGFFGTISDVRAKKNIHRVGTVFAAEPQPVQEPDFTSGKADVDFDESGRRLVRGVADVDSDEIKKLPIYSYAYKGDPSSTQHIGPMAQDVEKIDPSAVRSIGGLKHIDTRRVMGSILRAA